MIDTAIVFCCAFFGMGFCCFLLYLKERRRRKLWYVRYNDGHRTYLMPKNEAEIYKEAFGGIVYKEGEEKLPYIRKYVAPFIVS